jgi:hypothetical protein
VQALLTPPTARAFAPGRFRLSTLLIYSLP